MTNGVTSSAKILFFGDSSTRGCGATVRFIETGEPCMMSIAQSGLWVKKSRYGLFGSVLYHEKNAYINAQRTGALHTFSMINVFLMALRALSFARSLMPFSIVAMLQKLGDAQ